ncbi:heavy-metal-associated domain-containing protein [Candidatus Dependentiae bacterium]|jgi:cation transport ATPase|nr:heavy-metal-associated domain-containing protein [Candidatus Dependentiae bacterium]
MKFYKALILFALFFTSLSSEILEVKVGIDGMVCTACISTIKRALLDKLSELKKVKKIDLKTGTVELTLKKGNKLSRSQLQEKLNVAIGKSTYKFRDLEIEKRSDDVEESKGDEGQDNDEDGGEE